MTPSKAKFSIRQDKRNEKNPNIFYLRMTYGILKEIATSEVCLHNTNIYISCSKRKFELTISTRIYMGHNLDLSYCVWFTWKGFDSSKASEMASLRRRHDLAPYWTEPVSANSKMSLLSQSVKLVAPL